METFLNHVVPEVCTILAVSWINALAVVEQVATEEAQLCKKNGDSYAIPLQLCVSD